MSWVRAGERKYVPYENPERRRYNTLVLYAPDGVQPAFDWIGKPPAFTADDLIAFLLERPPCPVPLVIVLDNASLHHSRLVQAALPRLWARHIYFYFLPPYSPELNDIEAVFRVIKHCDLPERVYTPLAALEAAVDAAYTRFEEKLLTQSSYQLRPAAYLLRAPDTDISVLDLVAWEGRRSRAPAPDTDAAVREALAANALAFGGTGEIDTPKERAIRALLREMEEVRAEREAAEDLQESDYAATLADELEQLQAKVNEAHADLLGGNRLSDLYKKPRQAIRKAIRDAIRNIGAKHAELGRHLDRCVQTGVFCTYRPDPPVPWEIHVPSPAA